MACEVSKALWLDAKKNGLTVSLGLDIVILFQLCCSSLYSLSALSLGHSGFSLTAGRGTVQRDHVSARHPDHHCLGKYCGFQFSECKLHGSP